jgi:hypothetical protein
VLDAIVYPDLPEWLVVGFAVAVCVAILLSRRRPVAESLARLVHGGDSIVAVILTSMAYCVKGPLQLPPDAVVNGNSPRLVASLSLKIRTHTNFFNFSKLAIAYGASAVVRVAMVCNDIAIANSSLGHYKSLSANALSHIRQAERSEQ